MKNCKFLETKISKYLIGRTGNMIKNPFYSIIGKNIYIKENKKFKTYNNVLGKKYFNNHDKNQNYLKIDSNNYLLFSLCNSFLNDDNNKINEYFIMNILVYYL